MIDHLSVGVDDIKLAKEFYNPVFETIGISPLAEMDGLLAYGVKTIQFLAMSPHDGNISSSGNGTHIAFSAKTPDEVDRFYASSLSNGGTCAGEPGPRAYPHAEVYAAYVRDPFGNKLEVLTNGFTG
jgi:catechol 2,3-dioxygenase-like lactoylglutathione lyase family enzyme